MNPAPAVEFKAVCKTWGHLRANDQVSFSVRAGSLHALIGENGAGKSTAMKLLFGMEQLDSGSLVVHGKTLGKHTPELAQKFGIGMVHQHFLLAEPHSSLENIALALRHRFSPWRPIPWALLRREIAEAATQIGLKDLNWDAPIASLAVATQQKIEILKCLLSNATIMILDEPTAVLTPQESDELFAMIHRLRAQGTTIILITHKLREVMQHCDATTVLRRGKVVFSCLVADTSLSQLGAAMVGDQMPMATPHTEFGKTTAPPVISLTNVTLTRPQGKPLLHNITCSVSPKEIVGIAGVQGSGQQHLVKLLREPRPFFHSSRWRVGSMTAKATGDYQWQGQGAAGWSTAKLLQSGLAFIAEDRHQEGLLLSRSMNDNFLLGHLTESRFCRRGFIRHKALKQATEQTLQKFAVRPLNADASARSFSGGNQQKMLVGRALFAGPKFLIASEPTRGVDIGAIAHIHHILETARKESDLGILLLSSDLDELMALSDRILVLFEGEIVREFARRDFDERAIGLWMGGGPGHG